MRCALQKSLDIFHAKMLGLSLSSDPEDHRYRAVKKKATRSGKVYQTVYDSLNDFHRQESDEQFEEFINDLKDHNKDL